VSADDAGTRRISLRVTTMVEIAPVASMAISTVDRPVLKLKKKTRLEVGN
jgi:hypothetical protein